jgi:hypothetical protein
MEISNLYLDGLGDLGQNVNTELVWKGEPFRPIARGELPDSGIVAFIPGFRQRHITAQHPGRLLACLAVSLVTCLHGI